MPDQLPDDAFFEELAAETARSQDAQAPDRLKEQLFSALTGGLLEQDPFFEKLVTEAPAAAAPSQLKSRIYSALMLAQAQTGPLLSLPECKAGGRALCVFEELVQIAAVGQTIQSVNYCRVCHARVLAERVENAPIYWPGCPYVSFQNR
jgi:hypothetical protein